MRGKVDDFERLRSFKETVFYLVAAVFCSALVSTSGQAVSVNFEGLTGGQVVTNQFAADGVVISAINPFQSFDLAIAFDTGVLSPEDPDLFGGPWAGGNIADSDLGMILVVSENSDFGTGTVATPDDQRDGSTLVFDFTQSIASFGMDLIDVDDGETAGEIRFFSNDVLQSTVSFADLLLRDPSVVFGDRTANRINPFDLASLGDEQSGGWDRIEIELAGSGGVDNLVFAAVPEPQTLAMVLGGLVGLAFAGGRRRLRG